MVETATPTAKPAPKPKKVKPLAYVDQSGCTGCEACIAVCPVDCIDTVQTTSVPGFQQVVLVDEKRCIGCKLCAFDCPWETIYMFLPEEKQAYIDGKLKSPKNY